MKNTFELNGKTYGTFEDDLARSMQIIVKSATENGTEDGLTDMINLGINLGKLVEIKPGDVWNADYNPTVEL